MISSENRYPQQNSGVPAFWHFYMDANRKHPICGGQAEGRLFRDHALSSGRPPHVVVCATELSSSSTKCPRRCRYASNRRLGMPTAAEIAKNQTHPVAAATKPALDDR